DTREVGLDQLYSNGFVIPRAVPSRPWPGIAGVDVAQVWLYKGQWNSGYILNEQTVSAISSFLTVPGAALGKPYRLARNAGKSFQGSNILGMGFTLSPIEAQELLRNNPSNNAILFPFLNGEDLNSNYDQSSSRWVGSGRLSNGVVYCQS